MKPLQCGPKNGKSTFTCYSEEELNKLRELWNIRHPDAKITTMNTKDIWNKLQQNLQKRM